MELRQMEALVAVVRHGGFSAAAREINSTQSSVSKAILQLEHDCGEQLLERLPHGVVPTDAGRMVLEHARAMLAERDHVRASLKALRGLESGRLRIGMPLVGSGPLFAGVFAEFLRHHPRIKIELREEGGQSLEAAVQSGEIELAASLLPSPAGFSSYRVCDEPMMAVLPREHALGGRVKVRLGELADTPCLLFAPGFALNSHIRTAYARRGLPLVEAARSVQPDFMLALASAGLGVAYLPRLMVSARAGVNATLVDEPNFRWRLGLIWRSNARLTPPAQRFLEIAKGMLPRRPE